MAALRKRFVSTARGTAMTRMLATFMLLAGSAAVAAGTLPSGQSI